MNSLNPQNGCKGPPLSGLLLLSLSLFGLFLPSCLQARGVGIYTIKDLEILEKENNFKEFLDHAHDIKPSKRDEHWYSMVKHMANNMLEDFNSKKAFTAKNLKIIERVWDWSFLKDDALFSTRRMEFAKSYFTDCLSKKEQREQCQKELVTWWNHTPKFDPEMAIYLANLIAEHQLSIELDPFTSPLFTHEFSKYYCKKDVVQKRLYAKAIQLIDSRIRFSARKGELEKLASTDCWKQMTSALKSNLRSSSLISQEHSYQLLKTFKLISDVETRLFLTIYLLNGPIIGETFNEAWNNIKILGQNYNQRVKVLEELKGLDPLPGKIFAGPDVKRRKILIDHLSKNFPEYIDYYAKTCLNYLKGKGVFPNGNPTVECRDLFKTVRGTKIITEGLQTEFADLQPFQ